MTSITARRSTTLNTRSSISTPRPNDNHLRAVRLSPSDTFLRGSHSLRAPRGGASDARLSWGEGYTSPAACRSFASAEGEGMERTFPYGQVVAEAPGCPPLLVRVACLQLLRVRSASVRRCWGPREVRPGRQSGGCSQVVGKREWRAKPGCTGGGAPFHGYLLRVTRRVFTYGKTVEARFA